MNESDVTRKLRVMLEELGAVVWKTSDRFHASRPDLVLCHLGRHITVEVKIYPNEPTPAQRHELEKLTQAGGIAYIASFNKLSKYITITDVKHGCSSCFADIRGCIQWLLRQRS